MEQNVGWRLSDLSTIWFPDCQDNLRPCFAAVLSPPSSAAWICKAEGVMVVDDADSVALEQEQRAHNETCKMFQIPRGMKLLDSTWLLAATQVRIPFPSSEEYTSTGSSAEASLLPSFGRLSNRVLCTRFPWVVTISSEYISPGTTSTPGVRAQLPRSCKNGSVDMNGIRDNSYPATS